LSTSAVPVGSPFFLAGLWDITDPPPPQIGLQVNSTRFNPEISLMPRRKTNIHIERFSIQAYTNTEVVQEQVVEEKMWIYIFVVYLTTPFQ
jgi:hypothetical protein